MKLNTEQVFLPDLAADVRNAIVGGPFGSNLVSKDYVDSGVPVIRGQNMGGGKYLSGEYVFVSEEKAQSLKANLASPGDIVFTQRGTLGQVAIVPSSPWKKYVVSQSQMKATIDPNKADVEFLYYYFSSKSAMDYILANAIQTGVPHTNLTQLKEHPIKLPPLVAQRAVVKILRSLDNKIELNRQINTTLESMAQALFKSWFVDFDPVVDNALAAGAPIPEELHARFERRKKLKEKPNNPHPPLPADIQQLFPSSFVFTEALGWVPEGWEEKTVADMVDSISDTYPLKDVERVVFLNTGDILDGRFLHSDYSATEGLPGQAKKSIRNGDILYSEIRPQNKRFAFVDFDGSEHVVSTKLMVLRAKNYFHPLFPYFVLKQERSINLMQHAAESRSGTFPQITYKQLDQLITCVPKDQGVTKMFVDMALKPIFEKGRKLDSQSETLSNIRDSLLPKLLSGQLQIPEAEQQLAEVI